MKLNIKLLAIYFLLGLCTIQSQELSRLTQKGNNLFENYSYIEAIEVYLRAEKNGNQSVDLYANLADSYYYNADMENAVKWYSSLMTYDLSSVEGEYYFRYSQALKAIGDYKNSDLWLNKLSELNADNTIGKSLKFDPNYLEIIESLSYRYDITPTSLNTEYSEFATGYNKSTGVIFSSDRERSPVVKRTHTWTGNTFLELFSAQIDSENDLKEVEKLKTNFNKKYNESSVAITADGNTMYFTRNSYDKNYKRDEKGIVRLQLFIAKKINGKWGEVKGFPHNSINYSIAHPSLSLDEKTLYFTSDMPGTHGLSDIYSVSINNDGSFGEPKNLGSDINTEARETFPFISKTGDLYFSSDGHIGLGGLDIFIVPDYENTSKNQSIYNVGKPVNSQRDDFAFIINDDNKLGYFSSNREGGQGSDDIYQLKEIKPLVVECNKEISGVVIDKNTGLQMANALVIIYDENSNIIHNLKSDNQGNFSFEIDCLESSTLKVIAEKEKFKEDSKSINIEALSKEKLELTLELVLEIKPVEVGTDLFKLLDLNPIYFDYDKSFIRSDAEIELNKIITYLKEYPKVKIDVRSHTDSRGRDSYNLVLSKKRNVSTIEYLINKGGISKSRITGDGYGETQLLNKCSNGVKCSKVEHQENRRSEFIVVGNN